MKSNIFILFIIILTTFLFFSCEKLTTNPSKEKMISKLKPGTHISLNYPNTFQDSSVHNFYFGQKITDPFRWLEDDRSDGTKKWVTAQNKTTYDYIDKIPYRDAIANRLEELSNYERIGTPFKEGNTYYFFKNNGLQNQSVLYGTSSLDQEAEIIIDPNQFSEDGTSSLGIYGFSKDGKYFAYGISEGGSDWRTIKVKNLETGEVLKDKIDWVKFSDISWHKDGFFYSRYPQPKDGDNLKGENKFHAMYYHKLGTPQSKDQLIFSDRSNPKMNVYGQTTENGRFVFVNTTETTSKNKLYVKDLNLNENAFTPIVDELKNDYFVVDNIEDQLLVLTNHNAPNYKLIRIDSKNPEEKNWKDIIPESPKNVLQHVTLAGNHLVTTYIVDAASALKVYNTEGKFQYDIDLPTKGTVGSFSGKINENIAFFAFTSFTYPTTIFKFNFETKKSNIHRSPKIKGITPDDFVTKQVFYESKDGTKVPMFITHKKGLALDGTNPTLLYGYGGFNISVLPSFNTSRLAFIENGGVFVVANIRGGGEYGSEWYDNGRLLKKQNVFDDFIAAAEYLIDQKYTSSQKLAIEGRSNGGLLVGACMTQRPDLFKVALPGVGVLDMLRYHQFTIGRAWAGDYGLSSDSTQFQYLLNYSPLHNIESGAEYPATLVTTADHDDRVVPAHSFKFIAELQKNHEGKNPVLIRVETSAGHGAGKPLKMVIAESADIIAFTLFNMGEDVVYEY